MGFFQITSARNNQIVDTLRSASAALISVEVGEVSAQLLRTELARIIPVRWDWEVQQLGTKSYVVPFPTKEELDRMIAIGSFTTKNKEGTITFAEFVDDVQPIKVLDQTWVTVTKVPRALRSFLPLWAVGTIIGATQKVDMIHLRATGQVRILVAVYDVKKIPAYADVCVGNAIFRLYFKADEAIQADPVDPEDDDLLGESDKEPEGSDREMEDAEANNPQNPQNNSNASEATPAPLHNAPTQKQEALVKEALDLACSQLINEISLKVMLEADDGDMRKKFSPPTTEELADFNGLVDSHNKTHPSSIYVSSLETPTDHAELGGSSAPTAPLLGTDSLSLGAPLLDFSSPARRGMDEAPSTPTNEAAAGGGSCPWPLWPTGMAVAMKPLPAIHR